MNCIIPGPNLKVFAKTLYALAKIGDSLYIRGCDSKLIFVSINLRKTICVKYTFLDSFFSCYEISSDQEVTCKIQMKTLIPLFKGTHLDKKFDFVKLNYEFDGDILTFKMKYKSDDIVMTHKLCLMEPESLRLEIDADDCCNKLIGTSSFYSQLLNTFSNTDDEITLEISKEKVIARNYFVGASVKPQSVRSHINLSSSEFNTFHIENESTVNFSLKPFRTAIHFADGFNLSIALNFERGGKPLVMVMENPTFEVNFIVATLDPYRDDYQSSLNTCSIPAHIVPTNNEEINLTIEDQQALLNENWDDDMGTSGTKKSNRKTAKKSTFHEIFDKEKRSKSKNQKKGDIPINSESSLRLIEKCAFNAELKENTETDTIPSSPESPKTKKAKLVFGRCFESTFSKNKLGQILAPNSDSE